jgi:hypothetical protein
MFVPKKEDEPPKDDDDKPSGRYGGKVKKAPK